MDSMDFTNIIYNEEYEMDKERLRKAMKEIMDKEDGKDED